MGHRANLIVIQGGKPDVYYTHWAANTLDRDLFWGPTVATEFARQQRSEGSDLLDEVWAEGGALIDHDQKRLLWFGGEDILYDVPTRRVHLRMMREVWRDWTVAWATEGVVELADNLGISHDVVLTRKWDRKDDLSHLFDPPQEPSWISTIISTVRQGRCEFLAIDVGTESLLPLGLPMLAELQNAVPHASGAFDWASRSTTFPTGGIHVDWDRRELSFWLGSDFAAIGSRVQSWYPEWKATFWGDQFESHLRVAPGLSFPAINEREIAIGIVEHLTRDIRSRANSVLEIQAVLEKEGKGPVDVTPLALRDDVLALSGDERRALLQSWFPDLLSQRSSD